MDCLIVSDTESFDESRDSYQTYTIDNLISLLLGDMKKIQKDTVKCVFQVIRKSFSKMEKC